MTATPQDLSSNKAQDPAKEQAMTLGAGIGDIAVITEAQAVGGVLCRSHKSMHCLVA